MDSPSSEDSRTSASSRKTRHRRDHGSRTSCTGTRGHDPPAGTTGDPVNTREFLRRRRQADKLVARGQKEMFDLLDESLRRHFPTRRTTEGS